MQKFSLFVLFVVLSFTACQKRLNQSIKDGVLFTIDNQPVLAEEFIYLYEKNNFNNDSIYTEQDIKNYLDLFINFKLKVKAAYEEGIDTTSSFKKEFNTYKAELIKPYLLETQETDSLVKEAYSRLQTFIRASHILIRVEDFSNAEDTLKAYNKIKEIRGKAMAGEDFTTLAKTYSEDPSAKTNGGDLGYFTALRMVYPFENAAYKTPVGDISPIVKTQFGYHILKVEDKIPNKGKVQIAHIMVSNKDVDSAKAKNKIFEIYDKAVTGGDWNYLVNEYSDDDRTRSSGGNLGFFGQGQLPPQFKNFEEAAYLLDSVGEISEPVQTPYGWHILKLLGTQPPEDFETMKEDLKRQVARGERAEVKKEFVVERLKKEGNFIENGEVFDALKANVDSAILVGNWKKLFNDKNLGETIFLLNRQSVPVSEFAAYVAENKKTNVHQAPQKYFSDLYNAFVAKKLLDYEEQQIAGKHLDYRMLEKEYREGLLLFEVMQEHVWNKSMEDSADLAKFYQNHKQDYQWKKRADATIIKAEDKQLLEKIKRDIEGDSITYYAASIDASDSLLLERSAKKVAQYVQKYPSSKIELAYNSKKVSSDVIERLVKGLTSGQTSDKQLQLSPSEGLSADVTISLKSKSLKPLEEIYNKRSALSLKVEEGTFEKGDNKILDDLEWKTGIFELPDSSRIVLVKIKSILPPATKKLDEVRGKVISDYQAQLENEWIDALKNKHEVVVNDDVLKKIYKYLENK